MCQVQKDFSKEIELIGSQYQIYTQTHTHIQAAEATFGINREIPARIETIKILVI